MNPAPDLTPDGQELKPFLAHLEDLRQMLIRCAIALTLGMMVAFPLTPRILHLLKSPLRAIVEQPDTFLRSIEVAGAFAATMRIAFWSGLLLSSPALIIIIGAFVMPALTPRERKMAFSAGLFGVLLFVGGVVLGYFFTLPFALYAMFGLHSWIGIQAEWTVTSYVIFTTQLLLGFGLAFELPVVILILGRLGVVSARKLRHSRRYAIIAALVIGAVLTPPDIFSMMIMAVPLILLYELCIWMIWTWERRKSAEESPRPVST